MIEKKIFVRDLKEGDQVAAPFLLKQSALATGKTGKPFLTLVLMDSSGELEGRVWDNAPEMMAHATRDHFVWVEGRCQVYQGREQLVVSKLQVLREDEVSLKDYLDQTEVDVEGLYAKLLGYVDSMRDPDYRALAESVLKDDAEITSRMKRAPAAKTMHHAYKGGLLEHVVSITSMLDFLSSHYGKSLNRDLLFIGGFFHDIGKIWELAYDRLTEYTTEGQLVGHLVMGVELIERKIQELEAQPGRLAGKFPLEKKLLAKHVVLAHHGKLEYGSPKEPMCLEALVIHMIDDLDSKVNAIRVFTEKDPNPGRWTLLNRQYNRYFFKAEAEEAAPPSSRD